MSLFRPRGPGASSDTRPDRPVTKATVRLPRSVPAATVVAVNGVYGDEVGRGETVLTIRIGQDLRVVNAPRAGQLMPMAGVGDELRAGDALFALHFEPEGAGAAPRPLIAERRRRPGGMLPTDPRDDAMPRDERRQGVGLFGALVRVVAALGLLAAGAVWLVPLLAEFGFGTTLEARLAVALAGLALGGLVWRLLGRGAGGLAAAGVGLAVVLWAGLVVLTLTGANPTGETVSLPNRHALAPAGRTRVSPAAPVAALSPVASGMRDGGRAGTAPVPPRAPIGAVRFSSWPVERFQLTPVPAEPPVVVAARLARVLAEPAATAAPTVVREADPAVVAAGLPGAPVRVERPEPLDQATLAALRLVPAVPRAARLTYEPIEPVEAAAADVPAEPPSRPVRVTPGGAETPRDLVGAVLPSPAAVPVPAAPRLALTGEAGRVAVDAAPNAGEPERVVIRRPGPTAAPLPPGVEPRPVSLPDPEPEPLPATVEKPPRMFPIR